MNILAFGAHPDDIEYGCGGMLAKYVLRGHAVYLFIASDGALGGDSEVRRREQKDAARILGVREVFWGDYRDTEVPLTREIIILLESVIRKIEPRMIFVNSPDDTHRTIATWLRAQCRRRATSRTFSSTRCRRR